MKKCPFCAESIQSEAIKCRYCGERLQANTDLTEHLGPLQPNLPAIKDTNPVTVEEPVHGKRSLESFLSQEDAQPPRRSLTPILVAMALTLAAVVLYLGIGLLGKKVEVSKEEPKASPTPISLPTTTEAKFRRGIEILKGLHQRYLTVGVSIYNNEMALTNPELVALADALEAEPRGWLFTNAVIAYQQAGIQGAKNAKDGQTFLAVAGIRRAALERWLDGKLTKKEIDIIRLAEPTPSVKPTTR